MNNNIFPLRDKKEHNQFHANTVGSNAYQLLLSIKNPFRVNLKQAGSIKLCWDLGDFNLRPRTEFSISFLVIECF